MAAQVIDIMRSVRRQELFVATDIGESLAASLYLMLEQDGTLPIAFYQAVPTLSEFLAWLKKKDTLVIGCFVRQSPTLDSKGEQKEGVEDSLQSNGGAGRASVDIAGITWIFNIKENCGVRIGECGMVFRRKHMKRGMTLEWARKSIDLAFNISGMGVVFGSSVSSNRAALSFARRLGFEQTCALPKFSNAHGVPADIVISFLTREAWREL